MAKQSIDDLQKIKWSGENIISISHILHMILIRCNATYHVTTWWKMQTVEWMSYSGSSHFSDKLSYKILFVLSYQSKDMNLGRLDKFWHFSENINRIRTFLTQSQAGRRGWPTRPGADWALNGSMVAALVRTEADGRGPAIRTGKWIKKGASFMPNQGIELWTCWYGPKESTTGLLTMIWIKGSTRV
jgi:hypothetical protein